MDEESVSELEAGSIEMIREAQKKDGEENKKRNQWPAGQYQVVLSV